MNSIEGYQNSIELLKRTLRFYALKENYNVSHPLNNQLFSFIEMDGGTQARFTLDKLREIEELNEKLEKDYNAEIDALQNLSDDEILQIQMRTREDVIFRVVEILSDTVRGDGGYGSTGN
jgi:PHP family Zn ribbon phosphoesterase